MMYHTGDIHRDLKVATYRFQAELTASADANEKLRQRALKEANESGGKIKPTLVA
ncbi:MAG: hypothetical protein ABJN62_12185 [Halioglobus sp.]